MAELNKKMLKTGNQVFHGIMKVTIEGCERSMEIAQGVVTTSTLSLVSIT